MILTSIPNHLQKSRKNQWRQSKRHQKQKKHRSTAEKTAQPQKHIKKTAQPPKHTRKNRETTAEETTTEKPSQKKPLQKKPPSHESSTEKIVGAQCSNPVQPPKPPTIKKMVEPISKRKLAWRRQKKKEKNNDRCPTCA
jgi:hypothetical protein